MEVDVVVRSQRIRPPGVKEWLKWALDAGPPFGPPGPPMRDLTKDDFTLLDNGKPQPIAIFGVGPSVTATEAKPMPVPPGAVSNRASNVPSQSSATLVLIDLLNTPYELTDYARLGLKEFLRTLTRTDGGIALYSLGKNLHVLHDFTDDPQKLRDAAGGLERSGKLPSDFDTALADYGDLMRLNGGLAGDEVHARITVKAVKRIVQHLAAVPGRKNLVWVSGLIRVPPPAMALMQRANVVLYPVGVRSGGFTSLESEESAREFTTASGGRGFFDARDLTYAVQTAEEDTGAAYVLGYYPAARSLDGKVHKITVRLRKQIADENPVEVHYRSGYIATQAALPAPAPTLSELLDDPLESKAVLSGIGLVASATPEDDHPGLYHLSVTVDLHDIRLERKDGHFKGAFVVAFSSPSPQNRLKEGTVAVDLTDEQFARELGTGLTVGLAGAEPESGEIHVVVRDRATDAAGSVLISVAK